MDESPVAARAGGAISGDADWAWAFLLLAALAFVAYVAGLRLARGAARARWVVAVALAVQGAPLGGPLLLSSDAWTYWAYGRLAAVHDRNPYADELADEPADPSYRWAGARWRETESVYGPSFTLASEPLATAAGESHARAAWIYRLLAFGAIGICVLVAARKSAFAAAFVGWNPLLALHGAGGGHNDAWVGALVVGALALAAAGRRQAAGAAWATGVFVKWIPLVLFLLRALEARAQRRRVGHLGLLGTAGLLVLLATWRYGIAWAGAFGPLARNAAETTSYSLPHRLEQVAVPETVALILAAGAFAAIYAWLVVRAYGGRARLALAAGALVACSPYVAPWYLAWVVPLAAVEDDRAARVVALALTAYLLPQTIPV